MNLATHQMLDPDVPLQLLDGVGEEPAERAPQLRDHCLLAQVACGVVC